MLIKSLSNIQTMTWISFATKVQWTEGHSLYENKLQKTAKSVMFHTGGLISTASKHKEQIIKSLIDFLIKIAQNNDVSRIKCAI
jgi:hypothetical protein